MYMYMYTLVGEWLESQYAHTYTHTHIHTHTRKNTHEPLKWIRAVTTVYLQFNTSGKSEYRGVCHNCLLYIHVHVVLLIQYMYVCSYRLCFHPFRDQFVRAQAESFLAVIFILFIYMYICVCSTVYDVCKILIEYFTLNHHLPEVEYTCTPISNE